MKKCITSMAAALVALLFYWPVGHGACVFVYHEPKMPAEVRELLRK